MKALVSLLPEPYYQTILNIWGELEARFGYTHIYQTPLPHFTWQLGDDYRGGYEKILDELLRTETPLEVQTDIVTWFSGQEPVVYLRIIKSPQLLQVHQSLWERLIPWCDNPSLLYAPSSWEPHITLSMEERSWCRLAELINFLKTKDLRWSFLVDNLTMLFQQDDQPAKVEKEFRFGVGINKKKFIQGES